LLLLFVLIAGNAYTTAPGGHPAARAKVKPVTSKPHGNALPLSPPTVSYSSPHTYTQGQTISLAPTSSGVATFGYSTTATPYGNGFTQPNGLTLDAAGNLYVADYINGIIKIPAGNGTPVISAFYDATDIAVDAAGNFYVAADGFEYDGGDSEYPAEYVYKIPADGSAVTVVVSDANYYETYVAPYIVATDPAGNVFTLGGDDASDVFISYIDELPVGSNFASYIYGDYFSSYAMACDAAGNLFYADDTNGGVAEIPHGSKTAIKYPNMFVDANSVANGVVTGMTFDAAGNCYATEFVNGQGRFQMVTAGNLSGTAVTFGPQFSNPDGVAIDGSGNLYVINYLPSGNSSTGSVYQVKPTGGYFISPALPAGLHFDSSTGTISGRATVASPMTAYTVTAYNGNSSTTATVSFRVTQGSNDADLIHLIPTRGVFSPQFSAATSSYTASVVYGVRSFQLTPITASPYASITINGTAIADSAASAPLPLKPGINTFNVVVTAPDQVTTKTYSLTVTRPVSNNDDLLSLKRSAGVISPVFSAATTSYTSSVMNGVRSMTITPTASDQEAIIKVNGTVVVSGAASAPINLPVGLTTITIAVTATDGTTTKTYTLKVTRPPSNNDNLAGLSVNQGTLSPVFKAATTNYNVNVANNVHYINVTPVAADPDATIKINGTTIAPGGTFTFNPLPVGSSTILVTVKASDGTTVKTYVITVNRPPSNNNNLATLTLNSGVLTPAFNATITSYTVKIPNTQTSVTVRPSASDPDATITVNGEKLVSGAASFPLSVSVPVNINIAVTASDGVTTQTYTIQATRQLPNDAYLSDLKVSSGVFPIGGFNTSTANYSIAVGHETSTFTVTPTARDPLATITVNGTSTASGSESAPIPLALGSNTVSVVVTAQDGTTMETYKLTVFRATSVNADLFSLQINYEGLSPAFSPQVTNYIAYARIPTGQFLLVYPVATDPASSITINGKAVASGGTSDPIPLVGGSNYATIVVTAFDGSLTKTYTVDLYAFVYQVASAMDASVGVTGPIEKPPLENDNIAVRQGVSPNGDGINDYLVIDGIQSYPDNKLSIMNRNGQLVFETKGYDNTAKVFDGHSNKTGQMQLPGTYFYQLEYTVKGVTKRKTGYLVLKY